MPMMEKFETKSRQGLLLPSPGFASVSYHDRCGSPMRCIALAQKLAIMSLRGLHRDQRRRDNVMTAAP